MSATGRLLQSARQRAGLSQSTLARRSAIAQSVISAYESGRREPSVAALRRLAVAMGARLELNPLGPPSRPDPERAGRQLAELLDLVDSLPFEPRPTPLRFPPLGRR